MGTQDRPERSKGRSRIAKGSTGRSNQQGRDFRPRSANVLGADQSVPRQRHDDAWHRHLSPAATRRWEEEGRQIDRRIAALATRTPSRSPPNEETRGRMGSVNRNYGSPSIQRWRGEEDLTVAAKVKLMDSLVREMCHERGIAFLTRPERTRETEGGSVPRRPSPCTPSRGARGMSVPTSGSASEGPNDEPSSQPGEGSLRAHGRPKDATSQGTWHHAEGRKQMVPTRGGTGRQSGTSPATRREIQGVAEKNRCGSPGVVSGSESSRNGCESAILSTSLRDAIWDSRPGTDPTGRARL